MSFSHALAVEVNAVGVVNEAVENIGARRLQTVMEKLLEDLSFEAEDREGETVTIDEDYVTSRLAGLARDTDLSKYIL